MIKKSFLFFVNIICQFRHINVKTVKESAQFLVEPLTFFLNLSYETGTFPDDLKKAIVFPLFKGENPSDVCNYRPILLFSTFSKNFEIPMRKDLATFWI